MVAPARRFALALLTLALMTTPLLGGPLDDAKSAGQVGERIDGYVGLVDRNAPASVQQEVERINAGRRQKYAEIATKQRAPVEAVAQIAGKKLIGRAAPGEFVMGADGQWQQKP